MHFDQYQVLAMRTRDVKRDTDLLLGCMGIAGEAGEFIDLIKKNLYHQKPVDDIEMQKELGDVLWYMALVCDAKNWNFNDIACLNIKKLEERYPQGFSYFAANNRKV